VGVGVGVGAVGVTECAGGTGSAADDWQTEALAATLANANRMVEQEEQQLISELNHTIEGLRAAALRDAKDAEGRERSAAARAAGAAEAIWETERAHMLAAHVAATAQAAAAAHAEMSRVRGDAAEEASRLRSQCAGLEASLAGAKADAAGTQAAGPHTDALLAVEEGRRREEVADIKDAAVISTAAVRWGAEVTEWIDGLTFWLRATVMPPLRRQHAAKTAKKKTALNNTVLWSMLDLMWRCIPTECLTSGALKKKHGTFFMDSPPPTELEEVMSNVEYIEKAITSSFMKKDWAGGGRGERGAPKGITPRDVALWLVELDHGIDWTKVEKRKFKSSDAAHGIPGVLHDEFGLPPWTHVCGASTMFTNRSKAISQVIDVDDLEGRSGGAHINQGLAVGSTQNKYPR